MAKEAVLQLLAEPRVPNPARRVWRDWALVGVLMPLGFLEVLLRSDLVWRPVAFLFGVPPILTLLWRRTHPLAMVAIGFGVHIATEAIGFVGVDHEQLTLYVTAYLVLLSYALCRWGSGRDAAIGLGVMLLGHIPGPAGVVQTLADALAATVFLLFPAALGAAVRYRCTAKVREIDQVKLREREQLARDLHDTVAHHVSAILIQAQAGRIGVARPNAAVDALEIIEAEASRSLTEMRIMVSALRRGEDPQLAPQHGVADIKNLAVGLGDGPVVDVELAENLGDVRASVGAAIYRLAQESVTNAVRHARHATRIAVSVTGDDDVVRLTVEDDGEHAAFGASASTGFGLVGMRERANLLGGTLEAGPRSSRGWAITAVLPRNGARK